MPPVNPDDPFPQADRLIYAAFAARAAELTGYHPTSYLDLRAGQMTDIHIPTEIAALQCPWHLRVYHRVLEPAEGGRHFARRPHVALVGGISSRRG